LPTGDESVTRMGLREERASWNQVLFSEAVGRSANGRAVSTNGAPETLEIFCECGLDECFRKVTVPATLYLGARTHSRRYVVLADHYEPAHEHIVEAADDYWVVQT
jgi:hypothetical protein